jgi:hypothetical protein
VDDDLVNSRALGGDEYRQEECDYKKVTGRILVILKLFSNLPISS